MVQAMATRVVWVDAVARAAGFDPVIEIWPCNKRAGAHIRCSKRFVHCLYERYKALSDANRQYWPPEHRSVVGTSLRPSRKSLWN